MKILRTNKHGLGWSTANSSNSDLAFEMLTWRSIIDLLEAGETIKENSQEVLDMEKYLKDKYNKSYICLLGAPNLVVDDLSPWRILQLIDERDGYERID